MRRPELIFNDALKTFLIREGQSLYTNVSERNTCGRLAIHLENQLITDGLNGYYADVEYNRKQQGKVKTIINNEFEIVNITPDLIVHSRGVIGAPLDNLIAIEAKKTSRPDKEREDNFSRLIAMTKEPYNGVWNYENGHPEHVCGYAVGIFMEINTTQGFVLVTYFKKGLKTKEKTFNINSSS